MPDFVHVFDADKDGYAATRIPALVRASDGTLLAFCEARREAHDWAPIDLLFKRSTDGGATWSDGRILAATDGGPAGNPVPILSRSGTIHLLFQRNYARLYRLRSEDAGETWSEAKDITGALEPLRSEYPWKVAAPGPGHGIALSSGRLLTPVWLCAPPPGDPKAHRPSRVTTIYSDDDGETWAHGEIVARDAEETPNPSESAAAELSDGRVMLNLRNESARRRRLVCFSADGAAGWSKPAYDDALFEPICMASLLKVGGDLAFCNPVTPNPPKELKAGHSSARESLTIRFSPDDGATWPRSRVLDPGIAGYSDLAAEPDGSIFCLYESGKSDSGGFPWIALARVSREEAARDAEE